MKRQAVHVCTWGLDGAGIQSRFINEQDSSFGSEETALANYKALIPNTMDHLI